MVKSCNYCKFSKMESAKFCKECGEKLVPQEYSVNNNEIPNKTYTCWIGNISNQYSKETLQKHFKDAAESFGKIYNLQIELNEKHNVNQCFISFLIKRQPPQLLKNLMELCLIV